MSNANYDGLTRNAWPGTWSPTANHPIVLDKEIRGGLRSVSGELGDRLTDITGQRLEVGMLVYVIKGYSEDNVEFKDSSYYIYRSLEDESRDFDTGDLPNSVNNWTLFTLEGSSGGNFDAIEGNGVKFTDVDGVTEISLDEDAEVKFQSISLKPNGFLKFQDGTVQTTTAPRFFYEFFEYQELKDADGIIPGDYLYDYVNATLFVTSFVPFNGWVTNKGFGYAPGQFFVFETDVELIGGSGTGATVDAFILFGEVYEVTLKDPGTGYSIGDSLTLDFGDGGSGFEVILNSVDLETGAIKDGDTTLFDITVY